MVNITQSASANEKTDLIRVMMPVIILVILIVVGKRIIDGVFNGIKSPFVAAGNALGINPTPYQQAQIDKTNDLINAVNSAGTNPFSPNYYRRAQTKNKDGVHLITNQGSWDLSNQIFNAIGYVTDSPYQISQAFSMLSYKTQVSYLAERFETIHARNLFDFLTEKLDTPEQKIVLGQIINYVNQLPVGNI